ncbi:hypothetical protein [Botrimarina colliarenosi]|uniref:hypothetical protein n=1 Tax=Botrimarina colliarenosi TaxID=2528001 RepID=UPI0011B5A88A|nr:hypothetical protein [Botrimarina colliarenosi]
MRKVLVAALAPLLLAPATQADGPFLATPHQDLAEVVPLRVLDALELPETPVARLASRPTLDWRPGLVETSKSLSNGEAAANAPAIAAPTIAAPAAETPAAKSPEAQAPAATSPATPSAAPAPEAGLKPVTEPPQLVAPNAAQQPPVEADPVEISDAAPEASPLKAADAPLLPIRAPRNESRSPEPARVEPAPIESAPIELRAPESDDAPAASEATPDTADSPEETTARGTGSRAAAPAISPVRPSEPLPPLSRSMRNLRSRMRTVLSFYYRQPLNTVENDPWELMHAMLAYELHSRVHDGGPKGPYMTAVGHLCFNRPSKRQQMMVINREGKLDVEVGVGLQGHKGQLLAMLAQCNVSPDYPIRVADREFTIHDLIEAEQRTCYAKTELTFKLIGLGHYLASDARWVNDQGETWDIPRLIKEEREQPIRGAACGGTHRLAGLSLAFRRREARGEPLDGEYAEAAKFVSQYQGYAFQLQNEDGSLSTEWFRGRGEEDDIDRRLRTTGHLVEWLVYSLPEDQLQSYRTVRAVNYLTELLASNADHEWHLGSIGHAIHALVVYDKRVFRPHDADAADPLVAAVDPTGSLYRTYPIYRGVMRNSPPESTGLFGIFGGTRSTSAASRHR